MEFEGTTIEELNEYLTTGLPEDGEWYKSDTGEALVDISNSLHDLGIPVSEIYKTIEGIVSAISNEYGC